MPLELRPLARHLRVGALQAERRLGAHLRRPALPEEGLADLEEAEVLDGERHPCPSLEERALADAVRARLHPRERVLDEKKQE